MTFPTGKKSSPETQTENLTLTRRSFMIGSVSGSLVMGFGGLGVIASAQADLSEKRFAPAIWFEMDAEGITTINIAKAEMGQHVGTALARILADELGVAWDDVRIHMVDSDPKWGFMVTGGSWSVFTSFTYLSQAGAAGRKVLTEQGAKLLGVSAESCKVADSRVISGDQSISFAEIVQRGDIDRIFTAEELAAMPVKSPQERKLIGKPVKALDVPAKTNGTARFGIDAEIEGMVYARPLIPPTRYGSVVNAVDDSAARNVKGYLGFEVLSDPSEILQGWVMAIADNQWSAIKSANALKVDWTAGPTATISEYDLQAENERLADQEEGGTLFVNEGDVVQAAEAAAQKIEATYRTGTAMHFQLEPVNATVEFREGTWHVHTGNQAQSFILPTLAKSLQVEESQVVLHQYYLGGGFGRRLYGAYILPAALTAKAIGKPVKAVFTREDDARFDCVRSASAAKLTACFDEDNQLTGIDHSVAAGWPTVSILPGFLGDGLDGKGKFDPFAISGSDHWYSLDNHRVRAMHNELAQKTFLPGYLRSVGPGWINFGTESFMDEIAHATGADPIDLRLGLLTGEGKQAGSSPNSVGGAKRLANVLRRVAKKSNWGRELTEDEGMGVAVTFGQERNMPTWTACVARLKVDRESGDVKVSDLYLEFDCGTIIHPDGALAQAEGSALWGLSLALHEGTKIQEGSVSSSNLDTYSPLRLADIPNLHIEFVESDEFPVGMGEPGTTVVGPAVANAIFNAVGVRMRQLPISNDAVRSALTS